MTTTNPDGSEDVNDFLSRIRELGDRRDKEDEERTKKLEEEILQGRKERQARRAERARSIAGSPTLNPARLSASSIGQPSIEPPEHLEPTVQTQDPDTATADTAKVTQEREPPENNSRRGSVQDAEVESPTRAMPTLSRSRTGTLSWQQRPSSRDLGNRSPGSTSPTRSSHLRNASTASEQDRLSRNQFPQSSPSKDSSCLRQIPDRGLGSPTRHKAEQDSESVLDSDEARPLPGVSRDSTVVPEHVERAADTSPSPPRTASTIGEGSFHNRFSSVSSVSLATGLGSPVILSEAPKLDPPQTEASTEEPLPASPTQRRMSPERSRSNSPTKGLGGFVQSAMMRRSDSVSKRWSAQLPQGLSRSNSIVSNRNSIAAPSFTASVSDMTPTTNSRMSRESSPVPNPRPGSSHSEATVVRPAEPTERPTTPSNIVSNETQRLDGSPSRPLYRHARSSSSMTNENQRLDGSPTRPLYGHARSASSMTNDSQNADTASSPFTSRTMDPKRWSPQKASWLESALNRPPESPRHQRQPSQPSWQRERQSRGSVDLGRFKEVTPIGLMRTPPPGGHFKQPSISGNLGSPTATKPHDTIPESPAGDIEKESTPKKPELVTEESPSDPEPKSEKNASQTESIIVPDSEVKTELEPQREPEPEPEVEIKAEIEAEAEPQPAPTPDTGIATGPASEAAPKAALEPEPETEASSALESPPKSEPARKAAPSALNPKPNFSLPSRDPMSPRVVKPSQSPVVDFRANLRKREVAKDTGPQQEPEFKNVFGRLKKTETRNYVAPDELKGNILRGKAALNVTGGPKKTERVDEFKDSLVKQKEAMKAGGGSIRRNTVGKDDEPERSVAPVPEAIAKRNFMNRTNSIRQSSPDKSSSTPQRPNSSSPTSPVSLPPVSPSAAMAEASPAQIPSPVKRESISIDIEPHAISTPVDQISATLEDSEPAVEAKDEPSSGETASSIRDLPSQRSKVAAAASNVNSSSIAKGKLAGRINPALAGLLSRGPPVAAEGQKKELPVSSSPDESSDSPSTTLTHMTKGRARGPKRRLPKATAAPSETDAQDNKEVGAISSPEVTSPETVPEPVVSETTSKSVSDNTLVLNTENARTESPLDKPLPAVNSSFQNALNNGLQHRLKNTPPSPVDVFAPNEKENTVLAPDMDSPGATSPLSRPPVPPKHNVSPSPSPSPSTPAPRPQWTQQARYASTSPSPLRTSYGENQKEKPTTAMYRGIPGVTVAESSPRSSGQYSPPVPRKGSDISLDKPSDPHRLSRKMSAPSLVAQAADAREVITQFFKTFPNPRDRMDIDPQLMLMTKSDTAVVRTTKRQIWELTGDGKRQELPVNQEYVLYEGSMYLCVHLFEAQSTSSSEVYLWCGDDIPEGAQDDAQLLARKIARENGCKLEVIRQGREPMRFIQALGGIIITRRGSSSRSNSSALYMLCGRKHLGQMAFDEVDYSLRNLCSGFPFVISAPFGKLYLWKGKGSSPEETGAARLISMDLGLTGEFEEVDEGAEPESFFDDFAGSNEPNPLMTSEYWQLKPKYGHFRTRLLKVDHEMGQPPRFWMRRPGSSSPVVRPNETVREIEPFCYKNLTERDVYVLDTFFEIYVIVGEHASTKSADFASAVVFAHEYGILAASLQDRPFIPKSFVSLGGVPDRCQSAFRKWDQLSLHAPCVFPLDVAIEALRTPTDGVMPRERIIASTMHPSIARELEKFDPAIAFRATTDHLHHTWAKTYFSRPELYIQPQSIPEIELLVTLARRCRRRLVTVGSGHSPSDLTCTSSWLVNLDNFNRILHVDPETRTVTVQAGIRLSELGARLDKEYGLTLANLGSIDSQSIAGVIATGTHGSSLRHGLLSECIESLSLVLSNGQLVRCSATSNPSLFRAALVSLGALGIVVEVTFKARPSFNIAWRQERYSLSQVFKEWGNDLWTAHEFVRVWWLPYEKSAIVWRADETDQPLRKPPSNFYGEWFGYHIYHNLLAFSSYFPRILPWVEWFVFGMQYGFNAGSTVTEAVEPARAGLLMNCLYSQFVNEWALPLEDGPEAITRLSAWLHGDMKTARIPFSSKDLWVHCPVEVRVSDSTHNSNPRPFLDPTCEKGPTLYLNATLYRPYLRDPPCRRRYYEAFEWLMRDMGARPHWAKNFSVLDSTELHRFYGEDMDEWLAVRQEVDPEGMFLGEWHQRTLPLVGPTEPPNGDDRLPLMERESDRRNASISGAGDGVEWVGDCRWKRHSEYGASEEDKQTPGVSVSSPMTATSEESFDLLAKGEASIHLPDAKSA